MPRTTVRRLYKLGNPVSVPHVDLLLRAAAPPGAAIRNVLVVDDSRAQRFLVASSLRNRGFNVLQAASGEEALALCRQAEIDLVLSDWIMPGMNGVAFCRALRSAIRDRYVYFILLTSNTEKGAVAEGLEVGADDFLPKPVDPGELRARIKAGERVLAMERALRENNRLLSDTLVRLRQLYDSLDRDLIEARNLQQSLLRERVHRHPGGTVSMLLRPSGHIGGDMVGCFEINDRLLGLYGFDVSGHGVASALLTARIAGLLSGASAEHNIAIERGPGGPVGRPPVEVAAVMNRLMLSEIRTERYLTLVYAEIDHISGRVRMVQAGHPHPLVQRADGRVQRLGDGGMPVGLIEGAQFEGFEAVLEPGDRLFLGSDGLSECLNGRGDQLGDEGLARILEDLAQARGLAALDAVIAALADWAGTGEFADDISCVLYEFDGPP